MNLIKLKTIGPVLLMAVLLVLAMSVEDVYGDALFTSISIIAGAFALHHLSDRSRSLELISMLNSEKRQPEKPRKVQVRETAAVEAD